MSEDAEKTLAKIRALLARATHETTPPEEARTSAHLAARLIVSHGFSIGAASHSNGYAQPPPPPSPEERPKRSSSREKNYAVFSSKYRGRCVSCGSPYAIGDRIAWRRGEGTTHWRRGEGTTHYTCREFWDRLDDEAS